MCLALQPKKYIQRGIDDQTSGSTSNSVIAISAFAVGAAILTFGIFVNRNDSGTPWQLHGCFVALHLVVDSDPDQCLIIIVVELMCLSAARMFGSHGVEYHQKAVSSSSCCAGAAAAWKSVDNLAHACLPDLLASSRPGSACP